MPSEHDRAARDGVPDLDLAIQAAGEDASAVRVERQGMHEVAMTVERADLAAGRHLPQPDTLVLAHRGKPLAVGAEGDLLDETLVALQGPDLGPGGGVPEPDRVVPAPRGDELAVGAERDAVDPLGMTRQWLDEIVRLHIPDLDTSQAGQGQTASVGV